LKRRKNKAASKVVSLTPLLSSAHAKARKGHMCEFKTFIFKINDLYGGKD